MHEQKLRDVEIFQDLSKAELHQLSDLFFEVSVPEGQILYRTKQPARSLFVLREGAVVLFREGGDGAPSLEVASLQPGDHFGEFGISEERSRSLTARTSMPSRVLEISKEDLMAFIGQHPMVALRLHMAADRRLRPIDLSPHRNKRQQPRTRVRKRVVLTLMDSSSWVALLEDISVSGVRLKSLPPDWSKVGQLVRFHLGIGATILQLSGKIVWLGQDSAGLEFVEKPTGHDMKIRWAKRQLLALEEESEPNDPFWRACA